MAFHTKLLTASTSARCTNATFQQTPWTFPDVFFAEYPEPLRKPHTTEDLAKLQTCFGGPNSMGGEAAATTNCSSFVVLICYVFLFL